MTIQDELNELIINQYLKGRKPEGFDANYDLITQGILSSLVLIELLAFIEAQYKITFDDDEIVPETFTSINVLAKFIQNKQTINPTAHSDPVTATHHSFAITSPETLPSKQEPIAVIGMGCRFPGNANTPDDFWQLLLSGQDVLTEFPETRWKMSDYFSPKPAPGKIYARGGYFIDNIDQFDCEFFGITPHDAMNMDPQQRLLLEVCWETLENAGIAPDQLRHSQTGVYIGGFWDDYSVKGLYLDKAENIDAYRLFSNLRGMMAGRVAYILALQGPVLQLDSACSSSLLSIHLACQSLRQHESNLALAGGVDLNISPQRAIALSQMQAISADGHCKFCDEYADGFGQGEGCGIVALKRLSDAQADGDEILSVIRGSAVNHDGYSNGLTLPNGLAQKAVIQQALKNAELSPEQIQYVELHGTGTPLGDPTEVTALAKVMATSRKTPLLMGSVKTNIGHLSAAAGIASFIKVVLSLQHKKIPANLHYQTANSRIAWQDYAIEVLTKTKAWEDDIRCAGVSSFGMTGTNVHMLLQQAPIVETKTQKTRPYQIFTLSAKNQPALSALAHAYLELLEKSTHDNLPDICYSANRGRNHFNTRLSIHAGSLTEVQAALNAYIKKESYGPLQQGSIGRNSTLKIAFVFAQLNNDHPPLQPAQYASQPLFQATIDECSKISGLDKDNDLLAFIDGQSIESYVAYFSLQYAFAKLWQSWGIEADILLGKGSGALVSACIAGVFSLSDGLKLAKAWGQYHLESDTSKTEKAQKLLLDEFKIIANQVTYSLANRALCGDSIAHINNAEYWIQSVTKTNPENDSEDKLRQENYFILSISLQENSHWPQILKSLGHLYVLGAAIEWNNLELTGQSKITLPNYPFQRKRHWLDITQSTTTTPLHPLLHNNISSLDALRFSSVLSLKADFQKSSLSTIGCYIEMIRAAIWQTHDEKHRQEKHKIVLYNMLWSKLIAWPTTDITLYIDLYPSKNNLTLQIYSYLQEQLEIHCQSDAKYAPIATLPTFDLAQLQARLSKTSINKNDPLEIRQLYLGPMQVLSKVESFAVYHHFQQALIFHPETFDCAWKILKHYLLHTQSINLEPLNIKQIEIYSPCTPSLWIYIKQINATQFSLDIIDDKGYLCAHINTLSIAQTAEQSAMFYLKPKWCPVDIEPTQTPVFHPKTHLIICCGIEKKQGHNIEKHFKHAQCILLESTEKQIDKGYQFYANSLFIQLKKQLQASPTEKVRLQVLISKHSLALSGLAAMLTIAHLENPKLITQLIAYDDPQHILHYLSENNQELANVSIQYDAQQRYVLRWFDIQPLPKITTMPWQDNGVYLITGGLGGLGFIMAQEICTKSQQTHLLLTGRSPLDNDKKNRLAVLRQTGATVDYLQSDVANKQAITQLFEKIKQAHKQLNGIIHSAGIIQDNFIIKKSATEFNTVLQSKVSGIVNLDQASQSYSLDFFVVFSSAVVYFGNPGQVDYAAANAFMDQFVIYRNTQVKQGKRFGKTQSINWPLWQSGGMTINPHNAETPGMVGIQTKQGISAFYQAMALNEAQIMPIQATPSYIETKLNQPKHKLRLKAGHEKMQSMTTSELTALTEHKLKQLLESVSKIPVSDLTGDKTFEDYGIDSIMIMQLNEILENTFTELSKTLFYEYQTVPQLTDYLISDYPEDCQRWTGMVTKTSSDATDYPINTMVKLIPLQRKNRSSLAITTDESSAIAIIGLSGRYPQANDIEQYWQNLKTGKDCIIDIPKTRWSMTDFFVADKEAAILQGKSYNKWGGFIDGFANFDPLFFNISPKDAKNIDPQERLFLECAWQVFEDAGYTKAQLKSQFNGQIGVFAGITQTGFELYSPEVWNQGKKARYRTSFASLTNRLSYLLDLNGPSMPIDTMCSSSLTAIHEACEHLRRGECQMAIAGGVNLYLHPSSYIELCAMRMLTSEQHCKSFALGGDGFIPGEGVGAVLLKPLSQAQQDGDNIYAVIRSSGINHGGKTSGYTVPNPSAQAQLIRNVIDKANIDARQISYIEAHGTGTELGDPIEITGLSQAFQKETKVSQFCAIGSAKSNIGHLEAAAGIAGLTKILLQMKHKTLVPSLHANQLNPNINWEKTPFVVQQRCEPWQPMVDNQKTSRIAGISSLGAGGANAHIILEEYQPTERLEANHVARYLFILSAKNKPCLLAYVKKFIDFIAPRLTEQQPHLFLYDMCYTLQTGRQAMEQRLALEITSIEMLQQKLIAIVNEDSIDGYYYGEYRTDNETLTLFQEDDDWQQTLAHWIAKGKYSQLLKLWVKGFDFDWHSLYPNVPPKRISLPTYPFTKTPYWIENNELMPASGNQACHPLLQNNTSDFSTQRYTTRFTGDEFFLAQHMVQGKRLLPGVAYLEMVRAGIEQATPVNHSETMIVIKNVVWKQAIEIIDSAIEVHIKLLPLEKAEISFEIYSDEAKNDSEINIHCQGKALICPALPTESIDIEALQADCQERVSATTCYAIFSTLGIEYGRYFRGIEQLLVGKKQVLAKLCLTSIPSQHDIFHYHPGLLDSALQACIGFSLNDPQLQLPFAVKRIMLIAPTQSQMWAHVVINTEQTIAQLILFDINLYDLQGKLCLRMEGFSARPLQKGLTKTSNTSPITLLTPVWEILPITNQGLFDATASLLMMGGDASCQQLVRKLFAQTQLLSHANTSIMALSQELKENVEHILWIAPTDIKPEAINEQWIKAQDDGVIALFKTIKALLAKGYDKRALTWTIVTTQSQSVIPGESINPLHASIHGLVGSMAKEYPQWQVRCFDIEAASVFPAEAIFKLQVENQQGNVISYRQEEWYFEQLIPLHTPDTPQSSYRNQGVYVVIGGAGGIGSVWSEHMIRHYAATLIWIGRKPMNADIQTKIEALAKIGPTPFYISADATQYIALHEAYQTIKQRYPKIHGVVHSSIVLADKSLANMEESQFRAALVAKVDISVHLAQVFASESLDFMLFFSALQSFIKRPGQSNYAAGCTFKDAFAKHLQQTLPYPVKVINWEYWGSTGIVASETYRKRMAKLGIGSIEADEGMAVLDTLMSSQWHQIACKKQTK